MDSASAAGDDETPQLALVNKLLSLQGALRFVPHGSEQRPHLTLRRVPCPDHEKGEGTSSNTARFSFFARKRIEVKPGKEILFCVEPEENEENPFEDIAVVLEGDILQLIEPEKEKEDSNPTEPVKLTIRAPKNAHGLPPKVRKSMTRVGTYPDYFTNSTSSFGFPGYPISNAPPRVYTNASVQTDLPTYSKELSPSIFPEHISSTPTRNPPVHLPSPESTDHRHGHDIEHEQSLAEGPRVRRSLSPMDFSSTNSSPTSSRNSSLHPKRPPSRASSNASSVAVAESLSCSQIPSNISDGEPLRNRTEPQKPLLAKGDGKRQDTGASSSDIPPPSDELSQEPQPLTVECSVADSNTMDVDCPAPGSSSVDVVCPITDSKTVDVELRPQSPVLGSGSTTARQSSLTLDEAKLRPSGRSPSPVASSSKVKLDEVQPSSSFTSISSSVVHTERGKSPLTLPQLSRSPSIPTGPALNRTYRQSPIVGLKSVIPSPSPTLSNPLGIRPSHSLPKLVPTGPRSLVGTPTTAKKPVVIGAAWSAGLKKSASTASNVSSTPVPSSPSLLSAAPSIKAKASSNSKPIQPKTVSKLDYGSPPSPPPQPKQPPPPPPSTTPAAQKWKPIALDGSSSSMATSTITRETSSPQVSPLTLQRSSLVSGSQPPDSDLVVSSSVSNPVSILKTIDQRLNDVKIPEKRRSLPTLPTPVKTQDPTSSTKSVTATNGSNVPSLVDALPKPAVTRIHHPLPPKPQASGPIPSSYRPAKRERPPSPAFSDTASSSTKGRGPTGTDWPATVCNMRQRIEPEKGSKDFGILKILFSPDGDQFALICADRTLRIWSSQPPAEVARLRHHSALVSAAWASDGSGIITLNEEGMIMVWSQNMGNRWNWAKILTVPDVPSPSSNESMCMTYTKDSIAVSIPSFGVRVWVDTLGTWRQQSPIVKTGITTIRFVNGGDALVGGCRDGVLWYCEVPNGTLRVHSFLTKSIVSIDVNPTGSHILVCQEGGKAMLVTLRAGETRGTIERTYTSEKLQIQSGKQKMFPAVFATRGQAILYGMINSCALVWDRKKGATVYGLKHPEDDLILAAATYDGRPGAEGWMVTGTKQGQLFWWPQPVAAAPQPGDESNTSQRKRQKVGS